MLPSDPSKTRNIELKILTGAIVGGMSLLGAGLWYVQVANHGEYSEELEQQTFRTVRIPAIRGKILDRQGTALARNHPRYDIQLFLEEIRPAFHEAFQEAMAKRKGPLSPKKRAELGKTTRYRAASNLVERLERALDPEEPITLERARFTRHYRLRRSQPLPVVSNLEAEAIARFQEQPDVPPAFELHVHPMRVYPHGATAGHLLGYLRRIDVTGDPENIRSNYRLPDFKGVAGLERTYDEALRGKAGIKSVMVNSLGYRQSENVWQEAEPGKNLVLTLDAGLQEACERALRSVGPSVRGAAVVMDPHNGDILACASLPSYDPNVFIPKISYADWEALKDVESRPQVNRATAGIYPPGSVFKIVVGLAMLESGVCDPARPVQTYRYYSVGQRRIWDLAPPGKYDFYRAFKRSSNYYFIHFGLKAGWRSVVEMGHRFHFGEPVDLPLRQSEEGAFPEIADVREKVRQGRWSKGDTANLCIGQGAIAVTPLQAAVMVSAVANGGEVYWPRLVQRLEKQSQEGNGAVERRNPAQLRSRLGVASRYLRRIREAMRGDVSDSDGTGTAAAVPGMRIGGKTGTAEATGGRKITWFTSMAPIPNPEHVVIVMVEDGASGGETCAPVARQIYEAISRRDVIASDVNREQIAGNGRE